MSYGIVFTVHLVKIGWICYIKRILQKVYIPPYLCKRIPAFATKILFIQMIIFVHFVQQTTFLKFHLTETGIIYIHSCYIRFEMLI